MESLCKSYIHQDLLEKPDELMLYRKVEQGGLGLHNVKCKAKAFKFLRKFKILYGIGNINICPFFLDQILSFLGHPD